ncbi:MAG: 4'-phosphopantetheinyl transferase family protein [Janthinobacterium lividum]
MHLWHTDLAAEHPAWGPAEAALSAAERDRQARFRTDALRQTYGRAHGFLRAVLGPYAGQAASALALAAPVPRGKPALPAPAAVQFNLSYRAGRALLAVSDRWAVGADVETVQPMTDALALVQALFSGPEQAALRATAPGAPWEALFYTIWTRKEAYAKALGMGLSLPFADFSVLGPGADGTPWPAAPAGAQLLGFAAGPGHRGALAVLGAPAGVVPRHFHFPNDLLVS